MESMAFLQIHHHQYTVTLSASFKIWLVTQFLSLVKRLLQLDIPGHNLHCKLLQCGHIWKYCSAKYQEEMPLYFILTAQMFSSCIAAPPSPPSPPQTLNYALVSGHLNCGLCRRGTVCCITACAKWQTTAVAAFHTHACKDWGQPFNKPWVRGQ